MKLYMSAFLPVFLIVSCVTARDIRQNWQNDPDCRPVDYNTLIFLQGDGDPVSSGPKGLYVYHKGRCYVAETASSDSKVTKSSCKPVDFNTLLSLKNDGDPVSIGSNGFYVHHKERCYVADTKSPSFKAEHPKAYEMWDRIIRSNNGEKVEDLEGYKRIPAKIEIDRFTGLSIALIVWFILSRLFPRWI